jgi:hypothetical protein
MKLESYFLFCIISKFYFKMDTLKYYWRSLVHGNPLEEDLPTFK